MTQRTLAATAALAVFLLTGCSASAPEEASAPLDDSATAVEATIEPASEDSPGTALAGIDHCDQIAAVVAPYIENLVPDEGNTVDEWGAYCSWGMADDEVDWENNRSVSVSIAPDSAEKPDVAALAEISDTIAPLEDPWVDVQGGVAYTSGVEIAVASAIVTTVWLPGVTATVSGGQWDGIPALDGPAAVAVVSSLLG